MAQETVVELSHHQNIAAVKQCTSLEELEYVVEHCDLILQFSRVKMHRR